MCLFNVCDVFKILYKTLKICFLLWVIIRINIMHLKDCYSSRLDLYLFI